MDKSPDAFRTISEVAEDLQTPAHVLRFWESRFPQIRPVKRAGGRRYYRPSDVALLAGIRRLLHDEGMTIRGVQKVLREQGVRHVSGLSQDDLAMADAVAGHPEGADWTQADDAEAMTDAAEQTDETAEAGDDAGPDPMAHGAGHQTQDMPAPAVTEGTQAVEPDVPVESAPSPAPQPDPMDGAAPPEAGAPRSEMPPEPTPNPVGSTPKQAPEPPVIPDLPLFAGQDLPATPARPTPRPPPLATGDDADTPTLAARLRALPPHALAHRNDEAAALRAALADLHARLSDRARGPRR